MKWCRTGRRGRYLEAFPVSVVFAMLAGLLCACSEDSAPVASSPRPASTNLVVIGNSISRTPPIPGIGWYGDWGMAASARENDFSHLVGSSLGVPVVADNFSEIERFPESTDHEIDAAISLIDEGSAVVVELGDNVAAASLGAFANAYESLLVRARHANRLVCVGTWWYRPDTDEVISAACARNDGVYVYIGDVRTSPENPDWIGPGYENHFVNDHPHDWSMNVIARRVTAALRN